MTENKIKKSKWGIGIFFLYSGFVVFILAFVIFASMNSFTMVEDNYYQKSLSFQNKIDAMKNAAELTNKATLEVNKNENKLIITFPDSLAKIGITGSAHFFRPSDKRADQILPISLDSSNQMPVSSTRFLKGLWVLKLSWKSNGVSYYQEENLTI